MTLPTSDTIVDYPAGSIRTETRVLHAEALPDDSWAVVLERTSCHPIDAGWPDQGADRAVIESSGGMLVVTDAVVAATDGTALHLGADIPVRKGTEGWAFLVAHIVDAPLPEGEPVRVVVDEHYRRALSVGHTACHLASLALNRAMSERWTKEVRPDALGQPDFDGSAIESSLIRENGSTDTYRLNKSLRRKGFTSEGLAETLPEVERQVNQTLREWCETVARVHIDAEGPALTDRRYWVCDLPEASARIACGGTHVDSLGDLGDVRVSLRLTDADGTPTLTMLTDASGS